MNTSTSPKSQIALLGATGSIGASTLEVLRAHPEHLQLHAAAAFSNIHKMAEIVQEFSPKYIAFYDNTAYLQAKEDPRFKNCTLLSGDSGLLEIAQIDTIDTLVMAIVGTTGLKPTLAAIQKSKRIALASKEIMVMAGELVMGHAREHNAQILPVDSEHSGIFQCLEGEEHTTIQKVTITASGGAFRNLPLEKLNEVTLQDALKHPTWDMGQKVTLDCATMANKGLELIEARWLFHLQPKKLDAIIHPQSKIHALVEFSDNSIMAQIAEPSMVLPIQYALLYPKRKNCPTPSLDFSTTLNLEFLPMDPQRYPAFFLAKNALEAGAGAPTLFNAANEAAANAFIQGKIPFTQIPKIIDKTLDSVSNTLTQDLDSYIAKHNEGLALANELIN